MSEFERYEQCSGITLYEMNTDIVKRIHLDTVASTNSYARELLDSGTILPDMSLIDSDEQTAGRGQKGNSWETEKNKNLTFTIVCHPQFVPPARQFIISEAIALSIQQTLAEYADNFTVKWPNDIYWKDKKISGTLIECDLTGRSIGNCIVGSGININQEQFLSDAPNPISLRNITGKEHDKEEILDKVIKRFISFYTDIKEGREADLSELYMCNLYRCKGFYLYQDRDHSFEAEIADIEPSGHLVLRKHDGTKLRYEFKEVKFIL